MPAPVSACCRAATCRGARRPAASRSSTSRVRVRCTRPRAPVADRCRMACDTRADAPLLLGLFASATRAFRRSRVPIVGGRAAMPVTPAFVSRTSIPDSPPPESRAVTRTLPERPLIVASSLSTCISCRDHGVLQTTCTGSFLDRADASRSACFDDRMLNAGMTRSTTWRSRPVHQRSGWCRPRGRRCADADLGERHGNGARRQRRRHTGRDG